MDREWLTAKINELAEAREQYLIQSSHRLGQFDGRIAALREVLAALEVEGEDETDVRPTDD
jgi:hypothetical protein